MICTQCGLDKEEDQFLHIGSSPEDVCYKCIYINKTSTQKKEPKKCKVCKKVLVGRRWAFCSDICADEGNKINLKNHWKKRMVSPGTNWRGLKF